MDPFSTVPNCSDHYLLLDSDLIHKILSKLNKENEYWKCLMHLIIKMEE